MIPNRSALFALAALTLPAGAQAQHVTADISIVSGPVAGRVILGGPNYPSYHHRPAYREVIVVRERRGRDWYSHRGYRPVRVYYDVDRDCWYDRPYYRGLRAVIVYQDRDRYFYDGDWNRERGWHRHDRDDRYREGRYDDRHDNRYDDRRDRDQHDARNDERNDYRRRVDDRRDHDDRRR